MDSLYQVYRFLGKQTLKRVGLMIEIPVFIKDPLVALENPLLGIQEIVVRIENTVRNPYFHQPNVWAVVQHVLEFSEEPQALGRPVPWGFDGNRLIVVPHAGSGKKRLDLLVVTHPHEDHFQGFEEQFFNDLKIERIWLSPAYDRLNPNAQDFHALQDTPQPQRTDLEAQVIQTPERARAVRRN